MKKKTNGVLRQIKVPKAAVIAAKTEQINSGLNKSECQTLADIYLRKVKECMNITGNFDVLPVEYEGTFTQICFDSDTYDKIKRLASLKNAPTGRTIASLLATNVENIIG
jgi:hypothetical protein